MIYFMVFGTVPALVCWVLFFIWRPNPVPENRAKLKGYNIFVTVTAVVGVIVIYLLGWAVYRHGIDGGWWPVFVWFYSTFWLAFIAIAGSLIRFLIFRRRGVPGD